LTGVIFPNTRKQEGSRQPDYEGRIVVNHKQYRVAGWIKAGAKGKFLSLALKEAS
jgi:hypothetical protein